jgi:putative transposase
MAGRSDLVACGVALIEPGKPWQNGTNESFNGKFRDECLSIEWFRNCMEAKVVIEYWRLHYNEIRPHSSLNYQTPTELISLCRFGTKKTGRSHSLNIAGIK